MKKKYQVRIEKRVEKALRKLPEEVRATFELLAKDLRDLGPYRTEWPNYSKLGKNQYHCHLKYSWVACWDYYKGEIKIEVNYVGSRENSPY